MKWFSLIYQGDVHPATDEKVIPKEAFSQVLEGSEVVEKARQDAKKLLEETEKKCIELRAQAQKEGFEEGLEKFNEEILRSSEQIKQLRITLQQMVLPIALKAAKRIVGKELDTFPETIVDIVLQALVPISHSNQVTLFLNKEDKELVEKQRPKVLEALEHAELFKIEEKSDIKRGDCVIKTEAGMINASLENQWRALERAFERYSARPKQ